MGFVSKHVFSLEEIANLTCLLRQRDEFDPVFNWVISNFDGRNVFVGFSSREITLPFTFCLLLKSIPKLLNT